MMENLFVYGTLREPRVQIEVIGKTLRGVEDILKGYKKSRITIEGEEYPILIPAEKGSIEGLVLAITHEELKKIDEYETDAYKRELVRLESGKKAWVYLKA